MQAVAWQTVAEVLHRMQTDLDTPWDLERAARVAGYELHHFAHLFRDVVGEPPASYCRRLRLERAAFELLEDAGVPEAATRAGYASAEAFSRAFRKQFGTPPARFLQQVREHGLPPSSLPELRADDAGEPPAGLAPEARIQQVGPMAGWTVLVPSFEPAHVASGMMQLMATKPPDGAWQLGGIAQPWGWLQDDSPREFRCLRLTDDPGAPPPPLLPWRWPRDWFAVFDYEGPVDGIAEACRWMASIWPEKVGLRLGYGPLFSLADGLGPVTRARLHLPVRPMAAPCS